MSSYVSPAHKNIMKTKRRQEARARMRALGQWDPTYYRRGHLRQLYGISLEEVDYLLWLQGNKCLGCGTPKPGGRGYGWCVHHDHFSKSIIALLCHACNRGSGLLRDNPAILNNLAIINGGM